MSYIRYWNEKWKGLDVGHRGAGTSFKNTSGGSIRENTIASLKKAGESGADFVEFDVRFFLIFFETFETTKIHLSGSTFKRFSTSDLS
jgi:hypothetical protein